MKKSLLYLFLFLISTLQASPVSPLKRIHVEQVVFTKDSMEFWEVRSENQPVFSRRVRSYGYMTADSLIWIVMREKTVGKKIIKQAGYCKFDPAEVPKEVHKISVPLILPKAGFVKEWNLHLYHVAMNEDGTYWEAKRFDSSFWQDK